MRPLPTEFRTTVIDGKSIIYKPSNKGRCKQCDNPVWWAKSKNDKFLRPFGDPSYESWHICPTNTRVTIANRDDDGNFHTENQQATASLPDGRVDLTTLSIDQLINNACSLSERLTRVLSAIRSTRA